MESPYPVVLAGDLNDSPMSYTCGHLRKGRVRDTFGVGDIGLGATHIGTVPGLRIDGILADTTLTVHVQTHDELERPPPRDGVGVGVQVTDVVFLAENALKRLTLMPIRAGHTAGRRRAW